MPNWTNQQINAINSTDGSVLVSAAAGSGKTAVLVERVKKMITRENDPIDADRLLVVTFTRDAAAEMKQRIGKAINELIKEDPYNPALLEQKKRFLNAQISTIDSFCGDIVREYFHTLGISSDYRIGDKGELEVLAKKALDKAFDSFYNNQVEGFDNLLDAFSSKNGDAVLRNVADKISLFLETQPFPDVWLDNMLGNYSETNFSSSIWGKIITSGIEDNANRLFGLMVSAEKSLENEPELADKYLSAVREDRQYLENLLIVIKKEDWNSLVKHINAFDPQKSIQPPKGMKDHPIKISVTKKREIVKKEIEKLQKRYSYTEEEADRELDEMRLLVSVLFKLVKAYLDELEKLKRAKNILSFSDVEQLAVRLLAVYDPENGFEKTLQAEDISKRFDAVIVDEYQDVNDVQELIFNCVSRGDNLFTVGDVKQSIYSFRQARPQIFIKRRESYRRYDEAENNYPAVIILDKNFRSRSEVCDTVNFIFSRLMSKRAAQMDYTEDEYLYVGADYSESSGCETGIVMIDKSVFPDNYSKADLEARCIALKISELIGSGFMITDRGGVKRPVTYGDFAILLRKTSSGGMFSSDEDGKRAGANEYVKNLIACGIPAYCEDTENFFDAQEIKLLLNFLRVIDNPSLDIPLLSVICSPIYGFTPDELAYFRSKNRYISLYSTLSQNRGESEKTDGFLTELNKLRQYASVCSVDELIGRLLDTTALGAITSAVRGGEAAQKNINLLRVYARDYEKRGYKSLSDFIGFIDKLIESGSKLDAASSTDSSTINGVRVLSIHKSKGLEFPVCFIADTAHQFNKKEFNNDILIDSSAGLGVKRRIGVLKYDTLPRIAVRLELERNQIAEEMRLFYVALTRAREKLFVIGTVDGAEKYIKSVSSMLSGPKIEPYTVSSCKSMFEWMLLTALFNPSVRKDILPYEDAVTADEYPEWKFSLIDRESDLPLDDSFAVTASVINQAELSERNVIDYAEILRRNLEFRYPQADIMGLPQKVTASQIAHGRGNEYFERVIKKPDFISQRITSSTERGTAHHTFLQYCDFIKARHDINAELERLVGIGRLTEAQAQCVDVDKLSSLIGGSLFDRIINSPKVYREERFTAKIHPSLLDEKYGSIDSSVGVIMQGAVDLAFEENGKLVIIDYKTDRVSDIEKLRTLYQKQLLLYKEALRQTLGMDSGELIIVSVHLNDYIVL